MLEFELCVSKPRTIPFKHSVCVVYWQHQKQVKYKAWVYWIEMNIVFIVCVCVCVCLYYKVRAIHAKLLAESLACGKYLINFRFWYIIIIFIVFIIFYPKCVFSFPILQPSIMGILEDPYFDLTQRIN